MIAGSRRGWLAPSRVLPAIILLFGAALLFRPRAHVTGGPLTTYDTSPAGARGLYDVLDRLGFRVGRLLRSMRDPLPGGMTYVVLAPDEPLTDGEVNSLLAAVRGGAGLVIALNDPRLADSLGFELMPSYRGGGGVLQETIVAGGLVRRRAHTTTGDDDDMDDADADDGPLGLSYPFAIPMTISLPDSAVGGVPFLWLPGRRTTTRRPVVLGRTVGRGRVVAISAPDILRNRALRDGRPAVAVARAIEWIGPGGPVVFDEYHQGFGAHASVPRAIRTALTATPPGRTTLQAVAAALVLLLALGARPIAPTDPAVIARRSPLEHVGALARAYAAVDARALAADRLVGGLRRRHPAGIARTVTNAQYLTLLRTRFPTAAADVDALLAALGGAGEVGGRTPTAAAIAAAAANVEAALLPARRTANARRVTAPIPLTPPAERTS